MNKQVIGEATLSRIFLSGFGLHVLLAAGWWIVAGLTGAAGGAAAGWFSGAGALLWFHAWRVRLVRDDASGSPGTKAALDYLVRVGIPVVRLFAALIMGYAAFSILGGGSLEIEAAVAPSMQGLAFSAVLTLLTAAAAAFAWKLSGSPAYGRLRAGTAWLQAGALLGGGITIGFALSRYGFGRPLRLAGWFGGLLLACTAAELLLGSALSYFRPRRTAEETPPTFHSSVLNLLAHTQSLGTSFGEAINYQFGFEVSKSWFFRLAERLVWPLAVIAGGVLVLLSSVVIVEPNERGVVLRFGEMQPRELVPGFNWKAPWPVDRAVLADVSRVRRIHVGSHQAGAAGDEIYREDTPILWSNLHGLTDDTLLIVAPPPALVDMARESAGGEEAVRRAPGISLVGGDVNLDYRIRDLRAYLRNNEQPDELFRQIATAETSRELYRLDMDAFLGTGLIEAAPRIKARTQQRADDLGIGIEVLSVGFSGLHPPRTVAPDFHQTVIARQEQETDIQDAESYATRLAVEVAGDARAAADLLAAIDALEQLAREGGEGADVQAAQVQVDMLLDRAAGRVAAHDAEALTYRWEREHEESGRAERLERELLLRDAAPRFYLHSRHLATLERGMARARKFMLLTRRDRTVLRFNFNDDGLFTDYAPGFEENLYGPGTGRVREMREPED